MILPPTGKPHAVQPEKVPVRSPESKRSETFMIPIPANQLLAGLTLAEPVLITAVVTDSRKVEKDCVFVCFPGERADGHDFAAAAFQNGAAYVIANHPVASNYRMLYTPKMIGVTGSVGKTTTKEFCYAVLSAFGRTLKTEGNQNNEIGLPNTLFRLDDTVEYAVVEMGMSNLGEIRRLARCARPNAGIITMIGVSHLENLGTRENILKAKLELCEGLPDGAPLALNADDDFLPAAELPARLRPVWFGIQNKTADVRAENIRSSARGTRFTLNDREYGTFETFIPTAGLHTVYDALAAYAAATRLGLDPARAAAALADYRTTGMRQNIVEKNGVTVIEDCYNASPDSMKAALTVLRDLPNARRIALLGDMLELGEATEAGHRQVGEWTAEMGVDLLITYGPLSVTTAEAARTKDVATIHCQTAQDVVQCLMQNVHPGDALLAKASNAMHLDRILQQYYGA